MRRTHGRLRRTGTHIRTRHTRRRTGGHRTTTTTNRGRSTPHHRHGPHPAAPHHGRNTRHGPHTRGPMRGTPGAMGTPHRRRRAPISSVSTLAIKRTLGIGTNRGTVSTAMLRVAGSNIHIRLGSNVSLVIHTRRLIF